MNTNLPSCALRRATAADRLATKQAYEQAAMQTNWDTCDPLKTWAKEGGWPTLWLSFQKAFCTELLENNENFSLAVSESGLQITILKQTYTILDDELHETDDEYENHQWVC